MELDPDVLYSIDVDVRGGFADRPDIIADTLERMQGDELIEDGQEEAAEAAIEAAVDAALHARSLDQASWPAVTDCDRLDAVFDALTAEGVIALQNAGYTQSDGWGDIVEARAEADDPGAFHGYCFFHGQDLERAVHGQGLFLAFGSIDGDDDTEGVKVGERVVELLKGAGFRVEWGGTFKTRIFIPDFDWKRR
ncbi:DUF6891 domain-containing protein [Roseateles chitinivorans]|uniref:DUF6891 domain-containing protein n=1 Tax=Roseateles chitinivorans TaxID=2917965 RepID=UPI003D66E483